jgi:hypothetical protein
MAFDISDDLTRRKCLKLTLRRRKLESLALTAAKKKSQQATFRLLLGSAIRLALRSLLLEWRLIKKMSWRADTFVCLVGKNGKCHSGIRIPIFCTIVFTVLAQLKRS